MTSDPPPRDAARVVGTFEIRANSPVASALAWWIEAGVDTPVGTEPRAWLEVQKPAERPASIRPVAQKPPPQERSAPSAAGSAGDQLARAATDLAALAEAWQSFAGSGVKLFEGDSASDLLLVMAPSADDEVRQAFSGPVGQLFDRMLASIGRTRETVCLARLAPVRALAAGGPAMALPFIRRLADLSRPRAVVSLGADATAALLGERAGVSRLRGQLIEWAGFSGTHKMFPTFHPAMLLSQPAQKAIAWGDLRALTRILAQ